MKQFIMIALIRIVITILAAIPILVVVGGHHLRVAQVATSITGFTKHAAIKIQRIQLQSCQL
jgi:hypothetical protein